MLNIPEEVKQLFRQSSTKKNIRIHFPNGEREDITNSNLISESFSFTESICSQDTLKFGLCEASMVEFETFGVGNIKDCTIEVTLEVPYNGEAYPIPIGTFVVDSCEKQANLDRRKVVAYSANFEEMNPLYKAFFNAELTTSSEIIFPVEPFVITNFKNAGDISELCEEIATDENEDTNSFSCYRLRERIGTRVSTNGITLYKMTSNSLCIEDKFHPSRGAILIPINKKVINKIIDISEIIEKIKGDIVHAWKEKFPNSTGSWEEEFEYLIRGMIKEEVFRYMDNFITPSDSYIESDIKYDDSFYYMYGGSGSLSLSGFISICFPVITKIELEDYAHDLYFEWEIPIKNIELPNEWEALDGQDFRGIFQYGIADNSIMYSISRPLSLEGDLYNYYGIPNEEINVREIANSYYELKGCFLHSDRFNIAQKTVLKGNLSLYPSETLYPAENLYPRGMDNLLTKSMYKHPVWYDDTYTLPYSKVVCRYKNSETQKDSYIEYQIEDTTLKDEINYQAYDLSDNYIIQNKSFTESEITSILETFASNVEGVRYMPAEINTVGAFPYLEAGDVVQVITTDGGFETIILNRTLSGIQSLSDSYESRG